MFNPLVLATLLAAAVVGWFLYSLGWAARDRLSKLFPVEKSPGQAGPPSMPEKHQRPAERVNGPIKILFLASSPINAARLALGQEVREIESKLRASNYERRVELVQEWAVRPTDLQEVLFRHAPHVVHFSGHGHATGELVFEDAEGTACPVSVDALKGLFSILGDGISCVVLSACYSEAQAAAIRAHVPCVVGMRTEISDDAAIVFSSSFYLALGRGCSVQKSFDLGRVQIEIAGMTANDALVLLCRPDTDAKKVVLTVDGSQPQ